MPLNFCTPEVEKQREFFRGKREKWWNSLGVRVKRVEFFRDRGEKQRNSSGAKTIFFSKFLRGERRLHGILEGLMVCTPEVEKQRNSSEVEEKNDGIL